MHTASRVMAAGASFVLLAPRDTMIAARVPVVAVCAVRTGSGKSQTARRVVEAAREAGRAPVVVRHPLPYGDLAAGRPPPLPPPPDPPAPPPTPPAPAA